MPTIVFFLLLSSLLHATRATVYYVTTNDQHCFSNDSCHTIEYYINGSSKYFTSHTCLYFLPGLHSLKTDLIINSTTNFTITGNNSTITCTLPANIRVTNATNFTLMNINFFNCGKANYYYAYAKILKLAYSYNSASILLEKCATIAISNVAISVRAGYAGIFAVNMRSTSNITDLRVYINCSICPQFYSHISGIIFYYYTKLNYTGNNNRNHNAVITLFNYQYKTYGSCPYSFQYAITLLLFQRHHNVTVTIQSMTLTNLKNSSLLYCFGKMSENDVMNRITIEDLLVCNNTGNIQLKMFYIVLSNDREILKDLYYYYSKQQNIITFENCTFTNNTNMAAMIYVIPGSSRIISGYINLKKIVFCKNSQVHFIKVKSTAEIIWQLTTYIKLINVNICSNRHTDGNSLISVTNGAIFFTYPFKCTNNSYYRNIIELRSSIAVCKGLIILTGNNARQILQAKSGSYVIISYLTTINMSENNVYIVAKQARTFGDDSRPICPVQFQNSRDGIDKDRSRGIDALYKIFMLNNVHSISKNLPGSDISFENCTWLSGTAYYNMSAKLVYRQVMKITNIPIKKTTKRLIPLSVCPCINASDYDCYSPNLGSVFPGQTINIKLLVEKKWLRQDNPSTTIMVANTQDDNCSVVDSYQLSQTYFNHGCNKYNYTIWPSHEHINECKLFIGINGMPEMFYIEIKFCPPGFTLDSNKRFCHCDPLLDNGVVSVTSCNLNDQTILRPANSWITADTVNGSHTYLVSSSCPFDYCLPYSSHHNLSDPDSQCQYSRSGVLCGQCRDGLSSIFGSLECKPCTNIYLLLIIPITIVGIILVTMLFMFHLTVRNGTITSFIFYFNVIYINYPVFFPGCQSIICTIIMFINLDFSTKTCFYNGMDTYALTWLLLVFPSYLIIIATLIIVMSRYFTTVQRVTAKKALPVLATLFLLSYAKILRVVCRVLFQYFTITHLPSNHSEVVWPISTNIPLFGLKFMLLFLVCVILFLILLPFNVILLFTRKLSRFKFIISFKPLLDAYFAPYEDKTFYWTGLLLLIRTITLVLLAFAKDVRLAAISILLGGLLWWHGVAKPFRNKFENIQESVLILNLLAIHTISLLSGGHKLAQILIMASVIYFLLVVFFYCFIFRFKDIIHLNARNFYDIIKGSLDNKQADSIEMTAFRNKIADKTYNYQEFQEPLVEYEN